MFYLKIMKKYFLLSIFFICHINIVYADNAHDKIDYIDVNYESTLKDYVNYLNNVDAIVKLEESKYIDNLCNIEKQIQDLYTKVNDLNKKKYELKSKLSKECQSYINSKKIFEHKLAQIIKKSTSITKIFEKDKYKNKYKKKYIEKVKNKKDNK